MAVSRRASRRRYVLLIIVLSAVTLITLDTRNGRSGPLGALGRGAHVVVAPVQDAVSAVAEPIADWWNGVFDAGDLKDENRDLRERVAALEGKQQDADAALRENKTLHEILELPLFSDVERVTGRVVSRPLGNFDPSLRIDKGSEAGIAVGMPVIAPEGLVGKVSEVYPGGAKVQVLIDPQFGIAVTTPPHAGATAANDVARGQVGSKELVASFPNGTGLVVGDVIVTSPDSTTTPPDVRVGRVTRIVEKPGGTGIRAYIRPYVDVGSLQYLTVIKWVQGQGAVIAPTTTTSTTLPTTTSTVAGS
jgi:rod shape-determining protein MreC